MFICGCNGSRCGPSEMEAMSPSPPIHSEASQSVQGELSTGDVRLSSVKCPVSLGPVPTSASKSDVPKKTLSMEPNLT